jgi:hypothetical protein
MGEHKLPRPNVPVEDTGWRLPEIVNTPEGPKGVIIPATGLEANPCMMCRSFEKDTRRLMQHFESHGLVPDAQGYYETPIAKEIEGRKSLRIHPQDCGWCRRRGFVIQDPQKNTCPDFVATATRAEMALKLARGRRG